MQNLGIWLVSENQPAEKALTEAYCTRRFTDIAHLSRMIEANMEDLPALILYLGLPADNPCLNQDNRKTWANLEQKYAKKAKFLDLEKHAGLPEVFIVQKVAQALKIQAKKTIKKDILRAGDLALNPYTGELMIEGFEPTPLRTVETRILFTLMSDLNRTVSRDKLVKDVWRDTRVTSRNLDTHISRIRRCLESSELTITSVYGKGYALIDRQGEQSFGHD